MDTNDPDEVMKIILDKEKILDDLKNKRQRLQIQITAVETSIMELKEVYHALKRKTSVDDSYWSVKQFDWSDKLLQVLKEKFKFDAFRQKQLAAINATISGKDVILVMPTGGGKSLTYQLPALMSSKLTVVVSPLLSLITDQLMAIEKLGIYATTLNSNSTKAERNNVHNQMINASSNLRLIFVTPEWLVKSKIFYNYLVKCFNKELLERIVIDEIHCCSTWGHDFRHDYCQLTFLKSAFPGVPLLGLTATATIQVLNDVIRMLDIPETLIITAPFNRPNLFYKVISKPDKEECLEYLIQILSKKFADKSGIIYVQTIKECEDLTVDLKDRGLKAAPYHANMEAVPKRKVHERWLQNRYQVVVATIAFGMGIDKPDVRFVIHYSAPKSMEGFYQESGRAGRNGDKADCILMFSVADILRNIGMSQSKQNDINALAVLHYCMDITKCRRELIAEHFEDTWTANSCNSMCDICAYGSTRRYHYYNIRKFYSIIDSILQDAEDKYTLIKLTKVVLTKVKKEYNLNKDDVGLIVGALLYQNYLKFSKGATLYGYILYLEPKYDERTGPIILGSLKEIVALRSLEETMKNANTSISKREERNKSGGCSSTITKEEENEPPEKKAKV